MKLGLERIRELVAELDTLNVHKQPNEVLEIIGRLTYAVSDEALKLAEWAEGPSSRS